MNTKDPNYFLEKAEYFYDVAKNSTKKKSQPENLQIKPQYKRYYDPTTKHYYKSADIFGIDVEKNHNKNKFQNVPDPKTKIFYSKDNKVWYPENKVNSTDKHSKTYVSVKRPGTNFYQPMHIKLDQV